MRITFVKSKIVNTESTLEVDSVKLFWSKKCMPSIYDINNSSSDGLSVDLTGILLELKWVLSSPPYGWGSWVTVRINFQHRTWGSADSSSRCNSLTLIIFLWASIVSLHYTELVLSAQGNLDNTECRLDPSINT